MRVTRAAIHEVARYARAVLSRSSFVSQSRIVLSQTMLFSVSISKCGNVEAKRDAQLGAASGREIPCRARPIRSSSMPPPASPLFIPLLATPVAVPSFHPHPHHRTKHGRRPSTHIYSAHRRPPHPQHCHSRSVRPLPYKRPRTRSPSLRARFNNLVEKYTERFGRKPSYIARAPGRVNLIGEHIDYVLFGVFPAAVEQDVLIACGKRLDSSEANGYVQAENEDPRYTPQSFAPMLKPKADQAAARAQQEQSAEDHVHASTWHLDIDPRQLRWESYVKAGYYGVLQRFFEPKGDAL